MNRITKNLYSILAICLLMAMMSCKKWLDIQPEDKFTEKQIFSSVEGISDAINSVYIDMGKTKLYGANLTSTTLEILAQRYNVNGVHNLTKYQSYDYENKDVKAELDIIWTKSYINVVNLNKFIANLDVYSGVLDGKTDSLFRGEAYGLRAFIQFDLLRMYGPNYNTADSTKTSIPYYTKAGTEIGDLLPANAVIQKIIADLQTAEALLGNDPVRKSGITNVSEQGFLNLRNYRMNYFAIKGLQARVNMYRGDRATASAAAKVVINNASKFPWITPEKILTDKLDPDRVFSTEILFGLQSLDLYDNYRAYFAPDVEDRNVLAPLDARLKAVFESNENDYRYNPNWILTGIAGKSYKTFFKYADISNKKLIYRFTVPLLRLSEMYLIAAEADQNVSYLNTVRNKRGLLDLPGTAVLLTELQKEYQKEFFGEGQLWFYYKRRNITSVPNPLVASGNLTVNLSRYVFPLPLSELNPR
ncbi:RagB/SusD family nutrient uptake outer membrane protein [Pedobacter polysacchareus]|uniref:RagB/SusD family nutrient uptake outer membrane protein n=1 Tax=Pedobacter polysacchareus TaxID=2861973 RepID=UPI001C997DE6|nr:RagB/SusD family nutrient uptake outer membrane protein [Pedobacter polysacchareus]